MTVRPPPRRKGPPGADPAKVRSRGRGALLGLAIGDALGGPLEGKKLHAPPFPALASGPYSELRGGGPTGLKPGQVGADTQTAAAVGWSLRICKRYDPDDALRRYQALRPFATGLDPQTTAVLERHTPARPDAARAFWQEGGRRAMGNAALPRSVPLAVFLASQGPSRREALLLDCALTHQDLRCQLASLAYGTAISTALTSLKPPTPAELARSAEGELNGSAAALGRTYPELLRELNEALAVIKEDLIRAQDPDPLLYGPELHLLNQAGSVRVALRLAFWELFHAPDPEAGILDAVHRGGDTSTHGALTGALLGAVHGEEALPPDWRHSVLEALSQGRGGPLWDTYHPRHLLPLVD